MTTDAALSTDEGSPGPSSVEHLQIDAKLDERACYALSVNRRPPIRSVTVRNLDGIFSGTLTITVTSEWTASSRPPIREIVQAIDCPLMGGAVEVDFSSSRLDDLALAYLDDTTPASVIVTVRDADGHEQSRLFEILVLARNQWRADLMEITAAFIQTAHPAIPDIHAAASRLLERRTGSGSLEDYQSGPQRAIQIANAIYDVLSERIPTYLTTPPGEREFDLEGQRVRPLDMLLDTGQGNCIELACAFAACMYAAGIEPVIFLLHGHAFGGFYPSPRHEGRGWNKALTTEYSSIMNVIQQGEVIPLETTAIASGGSFADAIPAVKRHFVERSLSCGSCSYLLSQGLEPHDHPHMEAVLDVARARAEGILSLPVRTVSDGQEILVIDQGYHQPPLVERRDPTTRKLLPTSVPVRVQKWKTALLDLSRRTPLISFNALDKGIELINIPEQLSEIEDYLVDGGAIRIFGDSDINNVIRATGVATWADALEQDIRALWNGSRAVPGVVATPRPRPPKKGSSEKTPEAGIPEGTPPTPEAPVATEAPTQPSPEPTGTATEATDGASPGSQSARLKDKVITVPDRARELLRKARASEADTGVNTLHLALGRITWPFHGVDTPDPAVSSPLFLVPIRMQVPRGDKPATITMAEDAMTTPNYSLIEALRKQFGLRLSWFDEDMSDDSGLDIARGLDEVRREFMAAGLADRGLRVDNEAAIGLFPFQKVRLWKDLNDHWKDFLANPVVKHLVEVGTGAFQDPADPDGEGTPPYDDATLLNPQPADGAQTRAIVRALAGQSFVLEGPPGTGKSQTITNLLANALSRGMKVLFVAEKPDARSVVRERLQTVGLDPFCLDLHDQGSGPQKVKDQLRDALDFRPRDIEEKWELLNERYHMVVEVLSGYRNRLHGTTASGKSYFDSFESLLEMGSAPSAPIGRGLVELPSDQIASIRRLLLELPSYAEAAQVHDEHPWAFSQLSQIDAVDRDQLADVIQGITRTLPAVVEAPSPWAGAFEVCRSSSQLAALLSCARLVDQGVSLSHSEWRAIARSDWQQSVSAALDSLEGALALASDLNLDPAIFSRDLRGQSASVAAAANSFVMGRKGKVAAALGDLATSPAFSALTPAEAAATFERLAAASDSSRAALERLKACEGMANRGLQGSLDFRVLADLKQRAEDLLCVATAKEPGDDLSQLLDSCLSEDRALPSLDRAMQFAESVNSLLSMLQATESSISAWLAGRSMSTAVAGSLPTWQSGLDGKSFMSLRRWLDLNAHLSPLEDPLLVDFRATLLDGSIPSDEAVDAFDRALLNAVLTVVGEEQNFDVFDQARQDRLVRRFTQLTEERQELLGDLIPARLHASRRFDSSSSAGSVANLRTELATTRRGARSVRQLIAKYPQLISELTPCFLMGPDSVAKFIPPGSINFDLIVFDEASQIRVEEAIATMGRGQAVVVVGDSRQMPPSSAFASRAGGGEEDEFSLEDLDAPTEDAESILEETVEAGLPREMLAWHYRSRDEVLISFSNEKYYDRKLGTFPAPVLDRPGVGITYHRVAGQFLHSGSKDVSGKSDKELEAKAGGKIQTNPIEADAIVAEVRRHVNDPRLSGYTLGIVTLNKAQADHVEDKLRKTGDQRILDLLDHEDPTQRLLVLNLESVQGRERDIIILGTSFSNKAGTDKMPLNFGPLNNKGGERRLNVAITRARRQVIIYSSFDPEQLKDAKSLGVKHLHEYLMLAQQASKDRDALDVSHAPPPDPYVEQVAAALEAAGLTVRVGYGLSSFKVDIAVGSPSAPGQWLVGVLLDGREWSKRSLVLDRDGLPVTVLTRLMDWPAVARVWLPAWRRDPDEVVTEIVQLVDQVVSGVTPVETTMDDEDIQKTPPDTSFPSAPPHEAALREQVSSGDSLAPSPAPAADMDSSPAPAGYRSEPAQTAGGAASVRPFAPAILEGTAGTPDEIETSGPVIRELLTSLTDYYGPIEETTALKAVARAFGLDRVRQARLDVMTAFVPSDRVVETPFGRFLFPLELLEGPGRVSSSFDWYRSSTFAERSLDQISPHEFANAAVKVSRDSYSIEIAELATVMLSTFGYARKTVDATKAATDRISWAVAEGYLRQDGSVIHAISS